MEEADFASDCIPSKQEVYLSALKSVLKCFQNKTLSGPVFDLFFHREHN